MEVTLDLDEALASLQSLTIGTSVLDNFLTLNTITPMSTSANLKFGNHKIISKFKFQVTKDVTCCATEAEFPTLIPDDQIDALNKKEEGTDLREFVQSPQLTKDHNKTQEMKQAFFLKWLIDSQFDLKVNEKECKKPDFICFGAIIKNTLETPIKTSGGDWNIYALKSNDCIYLWNEKKIEDVEEGTKNDDDLNRKTVFHFSSPKTEEERRYKTAFQAILTGVPKINSSEIEAVDSSTTEQTFAIEEVTFGSHQLLLLDEIHAVDPNGKLAEIKLYASNVDLKDVYRKCWTKSTVCGIDKVVLGRQNGGYLVETEIFNKIDELIPKFCGSLRDVEQCCYKFEDRLLNWIKSHLKENDPKVVKQFSWRWGDRVVCKELPISQLPEHFLPKWYLYPAEATTD